MKKIDWTKNSIKLAFGTCLFVTNECQNQAQFFEFMQLGSSKLKNCRQLRFLKIQKYSTIINNNKWKCVTESQAWY